MPTILSPGLSKARPDGGDDAMSPEMPQPALSPALQAAIDRQIQRIKIDQTGAFRAAVSNVGAEAGVGWRFHPNWTTGAYVGVDWQKRVSVGAEISGGW